MSSIFNYVVLGGRSYEGEWLEGIFSSIDKAIKYVESKIEPKGYYGSTSYMDIQKVELDNPQNSESIPFTEEYILYCNDCKLKLKTGVSTHEARDFFDFHRDQRGHNVDWLEYTGKIILS